MKLFTWILKFSALFALVACGNGRNDRQQFQNRVNTIQQQNQQIRNTHAKRQAEQLKRRMNPLSEETRKERAENVELYKTRHGQVTLTGPMISGNEIASDMKSIIIVENSEGNRIENGSYDGKVLKDKIKTVKDGKSETKFVDFRTTFQYSPTPEGANVFMNNKSFAGAGSRTVVINKDDCLAEIPVAKVEKADKEEKSERTLQDRLLRDRDIELLEKPWEDRLEEYYEKHISESFGRKNFKVDVEYIQESETYFSHSPWFRGAINGEKNHATATNVILCGEVSSGEIVKMTAIAENVILHNFKYRMQSRAQSTMNFEIAAKNLYLIGDSRVESHPMPNGDFEPPHIRVETQNAPKVSKSKGGSLKIIAIGADVE